MASPTLSPVPEIHLLLISPTAVTAFNEAKTKHLDPLNLSNSTLQIHIQEASLSQLEDTVKFDLIVSPANSYGILDGGFDDAISRAFSPRNDYFALTRHVQAHLHRQLRGFAPPGTCTLVPLPSEWTSADRAAEARSKNVWGTQHLALLPTMRVPNDVTWDREVVYECVWSLLNTVYNHNAVATSEGEQIRSMLMSPLATGAGYVPEERWASQLALAIKHFVAAVNNSPEEEAGKKRTTWPDVYRPTYEVAATWRKDGAKGNEY